MSPSEFFTRLERESTELPAWDGELYLEMHRGTYTTQARNKQFNRDAEWLLRETEMLSAFAMRGGCGYEFGSLHEAWKLVLLNQFHDIIPGSSIDEVYADSDKDYERVFATVGAVKQRAVAALAAQIDTRGPGVGLLVFNSLSWPRTDVIAAKTTELRKGVSYVAVAPDGSSSPVQVGADGQARFRAALPATGYGVVDIQPGQCGEVGIHADARRMENECLRLDVDGAGRLRRIYDKEARRDVLAPGEVGNRFLLFEDKMASCGEAWDTEIFYNDKLLEQDGKLASLRVVEQGPVRVVLRTERVLSRSRIKQDIILYAGSRRIDFETVVEWGDEKDVLLKVAFPVDVRSTKARYDVQFGNVERPTHWNTPADFAMFEVPAQKWADLSEGDYGVALLNNCKYGHDIRGHVMRLTLLRAPKSPGKNADVNRTHRFTYALFPHAGDYRQGGVVQAAYELNVSATVAAVERAGGPMPRVASLLSVSGDNVVIETVKKAEDDGGVIVRLYECHGCRGRRVLRIGLPVTRAVETDLMEREERALTVRNGALALAFKPFQIRTVKLMLG